SFAFAIKVISSLRRCHGSAPLFLPRSSLLSLSYRDCWLAVIESRKQFLRKARARNLSPKIKPTARRKFDIEKQVAGRKSPDHLKSVHWTKSKPHSQKSESGNSPIDSLASANSSPPLSQPIFRPSLNWQKKLLPTPSGLNFAKDCSNAGLKPSP